VSEIPWTSPKGDHFVSRRDGGRTEGRKDRAVAGPVRDSSRTSGAPIATGAPSHIALVRCRSGVIACLHENCDFSHVGSSRAPPITPHMGRLDGRVRTLPACSCHTSSRGIPHEPSAPGVEPEAEDDCALGELPDSWPSWRYSHSPTFLLEGKDTFGCPFACTYSLPEWCRGC
jgi:hypothetical protein